MENAAGTPGHAAEGSQEREAIRRRACSPKGRDSCRLPPDRNANLCCLRLLTLAIGMEERLGTSIGLIGAFEHQRAGGLAGEDPILMPRHWLITRIARVLCLPLRRHSHHRTARLFLSSTSQQQPLPSDERRLET